MVLKDLKEGKFMVENGIVSTLTPLTTVETIEKEVRKEIEQRLSSGQSKELLARELGRAVEFLTANNWKVTFLDNDILLVGAIFPGKIMKGTARYGRRTKTYTIYIPKGYLVMEIHYESFPRIGGRILVLPYIEGKSLKDIHQTYNLRGLFYRLHPHCTDEGGDLCAGIDIPFTFDIDKIITTIKSCIHGSKKEKGTSIWDYNKDSPASPIQECDRGFNAYKLHKKKLSDDEIWKRI